MLAFGSKSGEPMKISGVAKPKPTSSTRFQNCKSAFILSQTPSTSSNDIVAHLMESKVIQNESDVSCVRLVPANKDISEYLFVSFKVSAADTLFEAIINPDIWPAEVAIRQFMERPARRIATIENKKLKTATPIASPKLGS